MYLILIVIYVIVCLFLIAVILLQAGRGGGLNEAFGGTAESVLGTQASTVLKRATEVGAVLFLILALVLAMATSRRGRSLFRQTRMPQAQPTAAYPGLAEPVPEALPVGDEAQPRPEVFPEPAPAEEQPAAEE